MPEEPITFEFIRKVQREEQRDVKLSKIPKDFYPKAKSYLTQKKKISEKKSDRTIAIEVRNIERLLEDIYNRRETKILNYAILTTRTNIPPQNLLEEEKDFFEMIVDTLNKQRERVLSMILEKSKELSKEKIKFQKVKFLDNLDEFVGVDLKKYGPFKKGDSMKIPIENAELLKKVRKVEFLGD